MDHMQDDVSFVHTLTTAPQQCAILSGTFAMFIQGLLFLLSLVVLLVKWKLEVPPRSLPVFLRDSSKQIIGAGVIHCWNLGLAIVFHHHIETNSEEADECSWYWINIMIDTTLGVGINYCLLRFSEKYLKYDSGKYQDLERQEVEIITPLDTDPVTQYNGENNSTRQVISPTSRNKYLSAWAYQILIWLCICSVMKLIVAFIMFIGRHFWAHVGVICTHWIPGGHSYRLVFVMIITPVMMNCFQFYVTDSFLMWKKYNQASLKN